MLGKEVTPRKKKRKGKKNKKKNPEFIEGLGPVSQKSRNFSGLFRVPQFPSYLRNAEVLSLQTSQSSWFFLHQKRVKRSAFQNNRIALWQLALLGSEKFLRLLRKSPESPNRKVVSLCKLPLIPNDTVALGIYEIPVHDKTLSLARMLTLYDTSCSLLFLSSLVSSASIDLWRWWTPLNLNQENLSNMKLNSKDEWVK